MAASLPLCKQCTSPINIDAEASLIQIDVQVGPPQRQGEGLAWLAKCIFIQLIPGFHGQQDSDGQGSQRYTQFLIAILRDPGDALVSVLGYNCSGFMDC